MTQLVEKPTIDLQTYKVFRNLIGLRQIREKGYLQPYLNQGKPCIAIGVNFSKKLKNVEAIKWEVVAG